MKSHNNPLRNTEKLSKTSRPSIEHHTPEFTMRRTNVRRNSLENSKISAGTLNKIE